MHHLRKLQYTIDESTLEPFFKDLTSDEVRASKKRKTMDDDTQTNPQAAEPLDQEEEKKAMEEKIEEKKPLQHPFQLKKMKIEDPEYMSEVPKHLQNKEIPGFPSVTLVVGKPGSGKTNVLINLLTRDDMWKGFFDRIYLMGPTVLSDKLYKHLRIPENQIVSEAKDFLPKLEEWTNEQVDQVQSDPEQAPKELFIFEDFTSYNKSIQKSPIFIKCFNTIRHHKASVYINIHKVKALERTARMSCGNIIIFPVEKTEIEALYKDYSPKQLDIGDFGMLCEDAWTPDEMSAKPFLYINEYAPWQSRFRKCFTHIIDVSQYSGANKKVQHEKQAQFKKEQQLKQQKEKTPIRQQISLSYPDVRYL